MPYNIPVDLIIHQYNPESWHKATEDIAARACHPEFVKSEDEKPYRGYEAMLDESLEGSNLKITVSYQGDWQL
ncbi:MAG: hypothetical protein ABIL62_04720 [Planctomycetota bacterium]